MIPWWFMVGWAVLIAAGSFYIGMAMARNDATWWRKK